MKALEICQGGQGGHNSINKYIKYIGSRGRCCAAARRTTWRSAARVVATPFQGLSAENHSGLGDHNYLVRGRGQKALAAVETCAHSASSENNTRLGVERLDVCGL